jgi:hypothetical protein
MHRVGLEGEVFGVVLAPLEMCNLRLAIRIFPVQYDFKTESPVGGYGFCYIDRTDDCMMNREFHR